MQCPLPYRLNMDIFAADVHARGDQVCPSRYG